MLAAAEPSWDGGGMLTTLLNEFAGYVQVKQPTRGRLQVRPFCRIWSSSTYCNLHQPDFLTGSSDNTCGAANINSSHIAAYQQCSGGGFSCQKFEGEPPATSTAAIIAMLLATAAL
jgi:hypothetical protein